MADLKEALVSDHAQLYDTAIARRYFAKFDRITGHLGRVAGEVEADTGGGGGNIDPFRVFVEGDKEEEEALFG